MSKTIRKYATFAILVAMAWAILHGVLLYSSHDVYSTMTERGSGYLYHKSITCPVVEQNTFRIHQPEAEFHALQNKLSIEEQKKSNMCWHCSTRPIIVDGFIVLALFGLLIVVRKE